MSIATKRGDNGTTGLPGGVRVSKADRRVDCYGTIDELISQLGFARSIAPDPALRELIKQLQRELFKVGSAIGTAPESRKPAPEITSAMVDALEAQVHRIEALPDILGDWSIPGEIAESAAMDVARTVCRRAERLAVALFEDRILTNPSILAYLNRLSDLLWLLGRQLELQAGVDSKLRSPEHSGPRWSRAW
ncbi:MAG: cob(I)yrinic acid a,c-diamide adenosyltransferase [Bryobacteraceae bacterium]